MAYVFSYKSSINQSNLVPHAYTNHNGEPNIILLDKDDFNLGENTPASKIQIQELKSDFKINKFTWDRLVEIDSLLKQNRYKTALILALTIPDICSKIEFGEHVDQKYRYARWFDENIYKYEIGEHGRTDSNFDCLNGYCCYQLRCKLVHGDTSDIESVINHEESHFKRNKNYRHVFFRLTNKDYSELFIIENFSGERYAIVLHSVIQLIKSIISAAENCYRQTENKSLFYDGCFIYEFAKYNVCPFDTKSKGDEVNG